MDSGLRSCTVVSPLGELLLVASPAGLVQVFLPSSKGVPATTGERHDPSAHCLPEARQQLHDYFGGTLQAFDLPLDAQGSHFQLRVWAALREIPYGTTCSYGDIATRIGADPAVASRAGGLGVEPTGQFLHRIRRAESRSEFFEICTGFLDHDEPMPLDPFPLQLQSTDVLAGEHL